MKRLILLLISIILAVNVSSQEKRLALLIGNSEYEHGDKLRNPVNDAFAMEKALAKAGFEVQVYYNLSQGEMKKAIDDFGLKLSSYDVGLFFYAGHGVQSKGFNYLIPVDAKLIDERQIEYDCVQANRVLSFMETSGSGVNMVILDACRNNPFERGWERSASGKGLAFMDAPTGTLIAYATAPGSTASDGIRKNGLYTEAILESIKIPNITAIKMFQNVRGLVTERSNNQQTPWEATSLTGDFYFVTDDNLNEIQSNTAVTMSGNSRGRSTIFLDGYYISLSNRSGLSIDSEKLYPRDFCKILKDAESDYWKTQKKANIYYYGGNYSMAVGASLIIAGVLISELSTDEAVKREYLAGAIGGLGISIAGILMRRRGGVLGNQVLEHYFPENFSSLQIGPTENGFGLALNF